MMGRKTIAEYLSDQHILQNLKQIGVDFAQGYWVGKPRPLTINIPLCALAYSIPVVFPLSYVGRLRQTVFNAAEEKMNVIISLIVYLVVFGLIWYLVSMLPLPAPVAQIVRVLFIILLILVVLSVFGIIPGGYLPRLNL